MIEPKNSRRDPDADLRYFGADCRHDSGDLVTMHCGVGLL